MAASLTSIQSLLFSGDSPASVTSRLTRLLEATAATSQEERRLQVEAQLGGVLRVATALIPRYRSHLPAWCQSGEVSLARFLELPLLQRLDLQTEGKRLEHPRPPEPYRPLGSTTTSGSTGTPIVTRGHRAAGLMKAAQQRRFQNRYGFDYQLPCAFLTSPLEPGFADPPDGKRLGPWSAGAGTGPSLVLDLMADTDDQLDWLLRNDPPYLATYPSNLQALLRRSAELGKTPSKMQNIVLSSEPVSQELMAEAHRVWGARCLPTYSSSEAGLMGAPRGEGEGYYVEAESVYLEVLRDDGSACLPGEVGRVVVTTLQDFLRPLIRYEVGDYAEMVASDPSDPITLPRLGRVLGRERTMIRLPDGRRVWPHFEFASLMELGGLRKWQLVQHVDLSMTARIVGQGPISDGLKDRVAQVVRSALPGVDVRVQEVDDIPRTARGKFMELISEIDGKGQPNRT